MRPTDKAESQKQVQRHWKLLNLLRESPDGLTLRQIAERLGVTERTVRRDIVTCIDNGVPLQEQIMAHGEKLWSMDKNFMNFNLQFSYDEAAALYLGFRFLEPLAGTLLWEAAESAFKKIRQRLGMSAIRNVEQLLGVFDISVGRRLTEKMTSIFDTLVICCQECREVTITYRSLTSKSEETYSIRPYVIQESAGAVYIIGYSCKSQGVRHWKLDRLTAAAETYRRFTRPKTWEAVPFAGAPKEPIHVRVRFAPEVARFVQEQHWHESEKLTEETDGSILADYELSETVFIKNRVLSYGSRAEILTPCALREEVRREIEQASKMYQKEG